MFPCRLILVFSIGLATALAQSTVTTPAVGAVNITIKKGMNVVSFPLYLAPDGERIGTTVGRVSAVTSNTISDSSANWPTNGDFLDDGFYTTSDEYEVPVFLRFTSGTAQGRTVRILSNTATMLTIDTADGVSSTLIDLTSSTLGVATNDRYEIIRGDTLDSLFGEGTVNGTSVVNGVTVGRPLSGNADTADVVRLYNNSTGTRTTYYFCSTANTWLNADTLADASNTIICSDTAIIYDRRAETDFRLAVAGTVPTIKRKAVVRNGSSTYLSSFWPKDVTLAQTNLHTFIGATDVVSIFKNGSSGPWDGYRYDSVNKEWRHVGSNRPVGNIDTPAATDVKISVGTGFIIQRSNKVLDTGSVLDQPLPYTL